MHGIGLHNTDMWWKSSFESYSCHKLLSQQYRDALTQSTHEGPLHAKLCVHQGIRLCTWFAPVSLASN